MNLKDLYTKWEADSIETIFSLIINKLREYKKVYYLDASGNKKDDEYLQIENINEPNKIVRFKRRNNNPEKWELSFKELKDAIKLTLRKGCIQRPTDYLHMNGTSNFVGTPLHKIISIFDNEYYQKYSLIGLLLPHKSFGKVRADEIDFKTEKIIISCNGDRKTILMQIWDLEVESFQEAINGPKS